MKLFIVLSMIACGYAAKLDRTYLPPASAATAGGSPGSLTAPGSGTFGQQSSFGSPSGPSGFAPSGSSPGFQKAGQSFGPQGNGLDQPASSSNQYEQPAAPNGFAPSGPSGSGPSASGFGPSGFGNQDGGARFQPERPQAAADRNAEILRYENENDGNTFAYSFETSNGISAEESGVATNGVQAQGGFAYTGDDGEVYRVTYTADENGYQPQGDHLPTPPPIPDEILRSIEENARAAAAGTQEGAYQPDANEAGSSPQQYTGAPSYNQDQSSSQSFNQPQGSAQGPSQYNQPQGSVGSSQYNQPQGASQGPSQQYGAPNAASRPFGSSGSFNQAQSGPRNQFAGSNNFRQTQSGPTSGPTSGYDYSAPTTSGRAPTQGTFGSSNNVATSGPFSSSRQDQSSAQSRPSQQYGAPTAPGRGSTQGSAQQYGATAASGRGPSQGPSQQYGAPNAAGGGSNQASQNSQQYNAPAAQGSNQGAQQFGTPASSNFGSNQYNAPTGSRGSNQPSQQYGAPAGGRGSNQGPQQFVSPNNAAPSGSPFSASRQDQSSAQSRPQAAFGSQAQDDSGYQYNRPQGTPFGQGPSAVRPQPSQFQSPSSSGPQYNQPAQSTFSRPGSSPNQGASSGSFGPTNGPAAALVGQSLLPGSRNNQGPVSRPTQSSFGTGSGPAQNAFSQSNFGSQAPQAQGSSQYRPGQSATRDSMPQSSPYQYNRPGASSQGPQGSQPSQSFSPSPSRQGSQPNQSAFSPATPTFGGPRQPPSFNPETGYTY